MLLQNIVSELISSGCLAMEIAGEETSEKTQEAFRKFVGPHDPVCLTYFCIKIFIIWILLTESGIKNA